MKIKEYLKKQQVSVQLFSDMTGLSRALIHHYMKETRVPSLESAYIIVMATNFDISFIDLLPEQFKKNVVRKNARS